ncbi:MAG: phosphatidate cytidylyltransferase [Termitinemataceae bacterium]|nr:MAG: phosphatidate cytidylyltransferase [Termitinemataceae bacterium]
MSKIISRLLIFFVGLPATLAVVWFLPQKSHLAVNVLVILFCALGAVELSGILKHKNIFVNKIEAAVLGSLIPLAMTLLVSFFDGEHPIIIECFLVAGASWILISRVFSNEKKLENVISYVSAGFAVLIYPGAFLSWIVLMNRLHDSNYLIVAFLCIVLVNDSLAWFFGILFGKSSRGYIDASPNKSIVGFIAGIASSAVIGIVLAKLLPNVFEESRFSVLISGFILGLTTGIAGVLGDLSESAIKRSANVKDSGGIVPGRGGILDSIDSLAIAAPVFYTVFRLLFI